MQNSAKILKLVATIELLTGVIFIFLAVFLYISGNKVFDTSGEVSATFIFMLVGLISLISSPILFFIAKRAEEKSNSPVQY
jgi:divalent metal cation (Fe/Co/Zn/Cd) transporter